MDLMNTIKTQWDRSAAIGCTAIGAILLLIGWVGVSGTAFIAEQAPYIISGGIGGIFFLGIGATLWISADLRDEWRKLDRIEQSIGDGTLRWAEDLEPAQFASTPAGARPAPELLDLVTTAPTPVISNVTTSPKAAANGAYAAAAPRTAVATAKVSRAASSTRPRPSTRRTNA